MIFCKVNADTNKDLCMNLNVQAMPTIITYQDGKEVGRVRGANKDLISQKVAELSKLA